MRESNTDNNVVVVTGANGFVGSHITEALATAGATVRAVVRRPGTIPARAGVREYVGEFQDPAFAAHVVDGATAAVATVHPMWSDLETQHRVSVEGTAAFVRAAQAAGVGRLVHISTAAVYVRPVSSDDIDESSPLVGADGTNYEVTKRDTETALAEINGITGIFVRPPAIFGPGDTSEFNVILPDAMREDPAQRRANPAMGISWIHAKDLAILVSDIATGRVASADDPASGPVDGSWTSVNAATGPMSAREYAEPVLAALGVEPNWSDEPTWTGQILADRARAWGWKPTVSLTEALAEIADGVRKRQL